MGKRYVRLYRGLLRGWERHYREWIVGRCGRLEEPWDVVRSRSDRLYLRNVHDRDFWGWFLRQDGLRVRGYQRLRIIQMDILRRRDGRLRVGTESTVRQLDREHSEKQPEDQYNG